MTQYKKALEKLKNPIRIAILGYGFMGSILYSQLNMLKGFSTVSIYGRDLFALEKKFSGKKNRPFLTDELSKVFERDFDIAIDSTGDPDFGAYFAQTALSKSKDVVSLNVETDSAVGAKLAKIAADNNAVYSGILGDEPGAIKELYDFSDLLGFEVVCVGKGKNNPLDYFATPDSLSEEAKIKGLSPQKLTSFVDGTNTMLELCAVGNAIGFTPDIPGCHGVSVTTENISEILSTDGILSKKKVLEYVFGVAPGVFAIIRTDNPEMDFAMKFLKMGKGPNYLMYRPYHLTSMEVPKTLCQVFFDREPSIIQTEQLNDVAAIAKKDLEEGEALDGIGGYTCYGRLELHENSEKIPIALLDKNARAVKKIKKGEVLTLENVKLSNNHITKKYYN